MSRGDELVEWDAVDVTELSAKARGRLMYEARQGDLAAASALRRYNDWRGLLRRGGEAA